MLVLVFYGLSVIIKVGGVPLAEFVGAVVALLVGAAISLIGANEEFKE